MSHYYLDSSALMKRYSPEVGSDWIKKLTNPASDNLIFLAEITLAEMAAAIASKHRMPGGITAPARDRVLSLFLSHCAGQYQLLPVDRTIINSAVVLTQHHRLRGYDAVQLATALVANQAFTNAGISGLTFVAADNDLLVAAQANGLTTENPNNYS